MGSTANRGYDYPDSTSNTQIWAHMKTLADDIDADVADHRDLTTGRPMVRLIAQAAQSCPNATATPLQFGSGSEDIDTHNWHDTAVNNTRITPTRAYHYRCFVSITMAVPSAAYTQIAASVARTGTRMAPQDIRRPDAAGTAGGSAATSALIYCNGTTDYLEAYVTQTSGASQNTNVTSAFQSVFEVIFERP